MTRRRFAFPGAVDAPVAGILDLPDGPARGTVLYAHCFTCSKDTIASARICRELVDAGFAAARIDFTGLGESGGAFRDTTFSATIEDLVLAAEHLAGIGAAPDLLVGHSLGGAAVLASAAHIRGVRGVATVAAPYTVTALHRHFTAQRARIERDGQADVPLAGRPLTITREFVHDLDRHDIAASVARLGVPVLFVHALGDREVPLADAERLYAAAREPKDLATLDDTADHLLTRHGSAARAGRIIAQWAARVVETR
ncbi:alpha/beta hydrolase family protein [Tomitella cavernea]|uniref:Serine aminopeptidase S33 domain-containing protein n=1 Tax=Tomitella cavernea TaxID=1387982 RepID=A0ABP9D2X6_9ACTN|nr:alpha/beta fold hydrolase [Tomitella cavernea]